MATPPVMQNEAAYDAILSQHRQAKLAADGRRGSKAGPKKSRAEHAEYYSQEACARAAAEGPQRMQMHSITTTYPPSTLPFDQLQPIKLADLLLETHHPGRVLFVRTIGYPRRVFGVQNAIEDETGDVDFLVVYNTEFDTKSQHVLPNNVLFAVKQPYYTEVPEVGYHVLVEHPSDLVMLDCVSKSPAIPRTFAACAGSPVKSGTTWKAEGNAAYAKKDYHAAVKLYSQGLESCGTNDEAVKLDLYRNRAFANLLLSRHEAALGDAQASIIPDISSNWPSKRQINAEDVISETDRQQPSPQELNVKAYRRAGCAAYELRDYQRAADFFGAALTISPTDVNVKRELKACLARQEEAMTGNYDFARMSESIGTRPRLDHASYLLNTTVQTTSKRGRGLFATTDLKAGDLVMCEKAFCYSCTADNIEDLYSIVNMTRNPSRTFTDVCATLFFELTRKLRHNPEQARRYFNLFDRGYLPKCTVPIVDGTAVVDVFQAESIFEVNASGSPCIRSSDEISQSSPQCGSRSLNAFGIWLQASYANHGCDANATRAFLGDMMILHANKAIAKGEEITMEYFTYDGDYEASKDKLEGLSSFACDCRICIAESKTSTANLMERQNLLKEIQTTTSNPTNFIDLYVNPDPEKLAELEILQRRLEATYDEADFKSVPRIGLTNLGPLLARGFLQRSDTHKAIKYAIATLRDLGFGLSIKDDLVSIDRTHSSMLACTTYVAIVLTEAYIKQGQPEIGKQFEEIARESYKIRFAECSTFERYLSESRLAFRA